MKLLLRFFTLGLLLLFSHYSGLAQVVYQGNVQSIAVVSSNTGTIAGFNVPAGSNRLLVVLVGRGSPINDPPTVTVSSITFNGMMLAPAAVATSDNVGSDIWYGVVSGSDLVSSDIVVTFDKAVGVAQIGAASFTGVDNAMPIGNTGTATSPRNTDTNMGSLTVSTTAGNVVVDCVRQSATDGFTFGAGQTELFEINSTNTGNQTTGSSYETATGSSTTMSWTSNMVNGNPGDQYGYCAVEIRAFINLPVELVYFKANQRKSGNQLFWQTASELNNEGFEIERSEDGRQWEILAFVKGHGTTIEVKDYQWIDETPHSGGNYYRLRQMDSDGKFEYSDIVQVSTRNETVHLFPNPVNDILHYQITALEGVNRVQLFDVHGKLIRESNNINGQLSLQDLPKGVYVFVLKKSDGQVQQRIIKE